MKVLSAYSLNTTPSTRSSLSHFKMEYYNIELHFRLCVKWRVDILDELVV